jgi:hypothetical protein
MYQEKATLVRTLVTVSNKMFYFYFCCLKEVPLPQFVSMPVRRGASSTMKVYSSHRGRPLLKSRYIPVAGGASSTIQINANKEAPLLKFRLMTVK